MAVSSTFWSFTSFLVIIQLLWSGGSLLYVNGCYTSIFSFGDSLADTGNLKQLASMRNITDEVIPGLVPPYGENFYNHSTGRCSNGRLIIDFLAESLGLPLIPPYVSDDKGSDNVVKLGQGVNFAVAGATALPSSFLEPRGIVNFCTNASLEVQLSWFKHYLPSICGNTSDCRKSLGRSLFLMGEIGGNDYNYPILREKPISEIKSFVPFVVDAIASAVNELIEMGAQTLVVPGNLPIGCLPTYLTKRGSKKEDYDNATGCLIWLNELAEYHNELLQTKLNQIRELHPNVVIMYADYYNAAMQIYRSPDEFAESLGLPLIPPYLTNKGGDNTVELGQGVNFAVAGATALDKSFLEPRGIVNTFTNASLQVQLSWFKHYLPSICGNASDCRKLIGRSLILMGEIGGNDYNYPILGGKPISEIESYVPFVMDAIVSAVNELIEMGAQTLVVPGNLPIGCLPSYLTVCGSEKGEYDNTTGCLVRLNEFSEYHNELLQTKLNQIRELHPDVVVIYADYYNAAMQIYRSPNKFGFTNGALKACCGGEGPFNFNSLAQCGFPNASAREEPDTYVSWDGIHLTEAAYRLISKSLFNGPYTTPRFNSLCPTLTSQVKDKLLTFM